jgi:nucleoid DNA-binding protein
MANGKMSKPNRKTAPAAAVAPATLALVTDAGVPQVAKGNEKGASLKKKELIDRVMAVTGGKKQEVKAVVEATLSVLGAALQSGEGLNLPPFGKARIAKSKGEGVSSAMTVKLRGAGATRAPQERKQALADPDEDS